MLLCFPDGLAYEWVTHKLYWTDAQLKTIHVYDIERRHRKTLIFLGSLTSPRAVVVDPLRRCVEDAYVCVCGCCVCGCGCV